MMKRIVKDEGVDVVLAERILDQSLAFLLFCSLERPPHPPQSL